MLIEWWLRLDSGSYWKDWLDSLCFSASQTPPLGVSSLDDDWWWVSIWKNFEPFFQIITEHYKALVASPQTDHYFAWCSVLFVPTIVICHWEATRRRAKKNQDKIYGAAGRRSVLTMLLRKSDTNINIKLWLNICILSWLEIYILSLSSHLSESELSLGGRRTVPKPE